MTGRIMTSDHRTFDLPPLTGWTVLHTGGVPCDSYTVTCPYDGTMAEVLRLTAGFLALEGGKVMLRATVDEYAVEMDRQGLRLTISGRGYAARLLDNESRPLTYQDATLEEILANHVTPYGIRCKEKIPVRAGGVYTVAAGASQWKALEGFCRTYGGFVPRFTREGELLAAPEKPGRLLEIGADAPVISASFREDHYGVLTEVLVIDKTRGVSHSVKNEDMLRRGGQCRRVLYTPGQSTWAAMRYTGEYQIQQSKQDQTAAVITLPGSFLAFPGDRVRLDLPRPGIRGTFRVAEAENTFDAAAGAAVTLTLKE